MALDNAGKPCNLFGFGNHLALVVVVEEHRPKNGNHSMRFSHFSFVIEASQQAACTQLYLWKYL